MQGAGWAIKVATPDVLDDKVEQLAKATWERLLRQERALQSQPEGGLLAFIRYFWDILEPATPFVEGWALEMMCAHLEAVTRGDRIYLGGAERKLNRLLLNVPPGFMKSMLVNIFWPAWEWGPMGMPHLRYVAFSYASELTERDNQKFRDLVCCDAYRELWGRVFKVTGDGKIRVTNDKTGSKFASSMGGVGTGERGDRVLCDDIHKIKAGESDEARKSVVQWVREAMSNRLNSLSESAIVMIMQRTHEDDTSGAIMKFHAKEYCHLIIPMEFETGRHLTHLPGFVDPREYDGELAWIGRYARLELEGFKNNPYLWAGQYQQNPAPRGGGIFKADWWQMYEVPPSRTFEGIAPPILAIASLDTAFKEKEQDDYTALTVWWVYNDPKTGFRKVMMVDAMRMKLPLHGPRQLRKDYEDEKTYLRRVTPQWGVCEWVNFLCLKRGVTKLLIEDAARGHDVANEMKMLYATRSWHISMVRPAGDKWSRAAACVDIFTDDMVVAPGEWMCSRHNKPYCMECPDENKSWWWRDWAKVVIDECSVFPRGTHDDCVDTVTMALRWLRAEGYLIRREEKGEMDHDEGLYRPVEAPLYPV